jgi:hypothetical protein
VSKMKVRMRADLYDWWGAIPCCAALIRGSMAFLTYQRCRSDTAQLGELRFELARFRVSRLLSDVASLAYRCSMCRNVRFIRASVTPASFGTSCL